MSGLAGVFYLDGRPVDCHDLGAMSATLEQRGPDGGDAWCWGPVGLAHRMLWTTPESLHERLPLLSAGGELAITADARIDNREELLSALGWGDRPPGEIADSQLILGAYEKWGERCPERLLGDFAFAIWDRRDWKLFCARDPMGLKPLYYHHAPGKLFACASRIKALLCLPEIPRRLNEVKVLDHLALLFEDRRSTFYEEIYQLEAAHCLAVDLYGLRQRRYWDLDASRELRLPSDDDYAGALREVFTEAVRCRLRSAFPVGSQLSGGLDSSSIVVVARKLLAEQGRGPLHTFSAVFPSLSRDYPKIDERQWIEAVVAGGGVEPHYVTADCINPFDVNVSFEEEPIPVPNLWLEWGCFIAARQVGVRVMLSGYDGDTTISYGHGYLADLARAMHWRRLYQEAAALARRGNRKFHRVFWDFGGTFLVPPVVRRAWRSLRGREEQLLYFDIPFHPEFARRMDLKKRAGGEPASPFHYQSAREMHRRSILSGLILVGPELINLCSASFGLETWLPFFDRRLLEFALALPTGQKLHNGWFRFALRRAMEGFLPSEVQWRTSKGDLSMNICRGLVENKAVLDEVILYKSQILDGYIDLPKLRAAYSRFLARPMDSAWVDLYTILNTTTLVQWLSTNFFLPRRYSHGKRKEGLDYSETNRLRLYYRNHQGS